MKTIPITRGLVALVDVLDFDFLNQWKWTAHRSNGNWYAKRTNSGNKTVWMHSEVCAGVGRVDHKNGDGLDNRRGNLRRASQSQNRSNSHIRSDSMSGFKGVTLRASGRWQAYITPWKGKRIRLGAWNSREEAARAYDSAARKYFGEFAKTNFV